MDRIVLFAKRPRAGHVKTRLTPPLTAQQALQLYRAFLADQLAQLVRFSERAEVELCLDGPWEFSASDLPPTVIRRTLQAPGDLGARIGAAFREAFKDGAQRVLALGVDTPTLPDAHVEQALLGLLGSDAVVGPSEDGGYTLIGFSGPCWELLRGIPWGRAEVLETTRQRASLAGVSLLELPTWYDVDDAGDLQRLRDDLRDAAHAIRAPATSRYLDSPEPTRL